jgi:hypothetical protein
MTGASSVSIYILSPVGLKFPQVEFDAPKALLKNPKGKLRALVDESGDKDNLYAMAEGKGH